mmetsp:Transcript_25880/g.24699  ORF Transcript_25880/g.24699 Transcript_25880/m.24699 type:complete len:163 (+) Transcript_25880:133-621(+)|eukprot:CAMPEP_0119041518 /NCGR_PEP_ID=MMETSP1177-20130426/12520_1 /TAXON_ID=2985 /ORGANISM="Ochromonas sp, Strain CCMP1899" /LENGTH=162 /DNA_ID=CAMNT_0007007641 /DNA_START=133 /DNA_END=621 /DNA_ORIENTATION=+
MGRYTSVQTFTDANTKTVSGYKEAPEGGAPKGEVNRPHRIEKVDNSVTGSCAGAGSEQFHIFRASRRRELDRLDNMDRVAADEEENRLHFEKINRNKRECDEKTSKNAEKRKRKKVKKSEYKKPSDGNKLSDADDGDNSDESASATVTVVETETAVVTEIIN